MRSRKENFSYSDFDHFASTNIQPNQKMPLYLHGLFTAEISQIFPGRPLLLALKVEEPGLGRVARALVGLLEPRVEEEKADAVQLSSDAAEVGRSLLEVELQLGVHHESAAIWNMGKIMKGAIKESYLLAVILGLIRIV